MSELLHSEVARKGGKNTFKKHGKKHYQDMAKTRWDKEKEKDIHSSDLQGASSSI